jgi:predicted RNase H-like HicB family nuclease
MASFSFLFERVGGGYVACCLELDVASQGDTVDLARANLVEAIELFLESASEAELRERCRDEVYVTQVAVRPAASRLSSAP